MPKRPGEQRQLRCELYSRIAFLLLLSDQAGLNDNEFSRLLYSSPPSFLLPGGDPTRAERIGTSTVAAALFARLKPLAMRTRYKLAPRSAWFSSYSCIASRI